MEIERVCVGIVPELVCFLIKRESEKERERKRKKKTAEIGNGSVYWKNKYNRKALFFIH